MKNKMLGICFVFVLSRLGASAGALLLLTLILLVFPVPDYERARLAGEVEGRVWGDGDFFAGLFHKFGKSSAVACANGDLFHSVLEKDFVVMLDEWESRRLDMLREHGIHRDMYSHAESKDRGSCIRDYVNLTITVRLLDVKGRGMPSWVRLPAMTDGSAMWHTSYSYAIGWPLRFVHGSVEYSTFLDGEVVETERLNNIVQLQDISIKDLVEKSHPPGGFYVLPYGIKWFSLAANLLFFFAVVSSVSFLASRSVSRFRKRKGLCLTCGYPIDAAFSVCPECGVGRNHSTRNNE